MALLDGVRALFPFSKQQEALKSLPTISPEEAGGAGPGRSWCGMESSQGWRGDDSIVKKPAGLPDPGGEVLNPEHVLQSLMVDAGYLQDEPDFRCPPLATLMKG